MCNNDITPKQKNQRSVDDFLARSAEKSWQMQRMIEYGRDVMPEGRRNAAMGCGKFLTFLHDKDMTTSKLEIGFFCKNRLCPGCAWRKAAHDAVMLSCMLQEAAARGYKLFFATLTAKTCKKEDLSSAIELYDKAYTAMMRTGKFKRLPGAIRKLEVTYNAEKDWYHPHIHSVWIVNQSWGRRNNPDTITVEELTDAWAHQLGGVYAVNAAAQDIRPVKSATREDIMEFAKYPAKSCEYLHSKEVFETFYYALRGIRLITHMRLARQLKREYKDGLLNHHAEKDETEYYYRSAWVWDVHGYRLDKLEELSEPMKFAIQDTDETLEGEKPP